MIAPLAPGDLARHRLLDATPARRPAWSLRPVTRHVRGATELGPVFDSRGPAGFTRYSPTVRLTNLYALPPTPDRFLDLPRETSDCGGKVIRAGRRVD